MFKVQLDVVLGDDTVAQFAESVTKDLERGSVEVELVREVGPSGHPVLELAARDWRHLVLALARYAGIREYEWGTLHDVTALVEEVDSDELTEAEANEALDEQFIVERAHTLPLEGDEQLYAG